MHDGAFHAAQSTAPGFVVYRGPSRIDGAPIVAVITRTSQNTKIGQMAQAWVLCPDMTPDAAIRAGADTAICGDCVHRSGSAVGRSCYVIWWQGPTAIYKALQAGRYPELTPAAASRALAGGQLRLAAYGDPAAVPFDVWRRVLLHLTRAIGYTHQWRTCDQRFRSMLMASVETHREADEAHVLGWRTFRARRPMDSLRADEITCPASDEAGHQTTCDKCGLCSGMMRPTARSIAILLHGQRTAHLDPVKHDVQISGLRSVAVEA